MSFIPCVAWVPKGVSKRLPEKEVLTQGELRRILKASKEEVEDMMAGDHDDEGTSTSNAHKSKDKIEDEYRMDDYDNEPDDARENLLGDLELLTTDDKFDDHDGIADDDSDDSDDEIRDDDNLILVGHVDDDEANLEVYVYNSEESYLYVHHEIMLTDLPLCLEWLSYNKDDSTKPANLVAVGSTSPIIEIWDLDVIDSLNCKCKLGRKKSKKKIISDGAHRCCAGPLMEQTSQECAGEWFSRQQCYIVGLVYRTGCQDIGAA